VKEVKVYDLSSDIENIEPFDFQDFFKKIEEINEGFSKIGKNLLEDIAKIELPIIELPKFDLPEIEVDYERIRRITESNSKHGWTLTGDMGLGDYLNDELLNTPMSEVDSYFYSYYTFKDEGKGVDIYRNAKASIRETINPKWHVLIDECFRSYDLEMFKIAIPNLMTIIEGEVSEITESDYVGGKLINKFKVNAITEDDRFSTISIYSLYLFLKNHLFKYREFKKERSDIINRNWVLHGRDNPSLWTKIDYFRLLNTLDSIQFTKKILQ
jgi:hypothetical protein